MQKGFINLSLTGYIILGLTVALLINLALLKIQTSRLESEKAEFSAFRSEVNAAGIAAKAKAEAEIKRQEQVTKEVSKSYENRIASIRSTFDNRLRDAYTSGGKLSALPEAPRSINDLTPDAIPLAGLCAETTEQLIQLQGWVTEMGRQ